MGRDRFPRERVNRQHAQGLRRLALERPPRTSPSTFSIRAALSARKLNSLVCKFDHLRIDFAQESPKRASSQTASIEGHSRSQRE